MPPQQAAPFYERFVDRVRGGYERERVKGEVGRPLEASQLAPWRLSFVAACSRQLIPFHWMVFVAPSFSISTVDQACSLAWPRVSCSQDGAMEVIAHAGVLPDYISRPLNPSLSHRFHTMVPLRSLFPVCPACPHPPTCHPPSLSLKALFFTLPSLLSSTSC